jgi:hypothetical protein
MTDTTEGSSAGGGSPGAAHVPEPVLECPAKWMRSGPLLVWTTRGTLRVGEGRISFKTGKRTVFDAPIEDLRDVRFPRCNLGTVAKFKLDGKRFRIMWDQTSYTLYDVGGSEVLSDFKTNLPEARETGRELKRRLGVS